MAYFPRLDELAVAANSRGLFEGMLVYCDRENARDLEFANGNIEMELDIENMTICEYLEYEAAKERRLWDDVRSRRSPTHYDETDFNSFHQNKSNTFYYPYSRYLHTPPVQPYPKNYLVSTKHTPNTSKMDSDFDKILDDLFRTGAENIKRMGHDIVQDGIWEQDDDSEEDQEEDDDDGDTFDMWDITVKDVERIRKFFNVPNE
ncbi:hypothetical protein Tco_1143797 [Tanacetum coccineum]